jgi:hypothetical protein
MNIEISKNRRRKSGWVSFNTYLPDFIGAALVYDEGDGVENPLDYMGYGVRIGSRVSKLELRDPRTDEVKYRWDRGEDINNVASHIIDDVDAFLNDLPTVDEREMTIDEMEATIAKASAQRALTKYRKTLETAYMELDLLSDEGKLDTLTSEQRKKIQLAKRQIINARDNLVKVEYA